MEAFKVASDRNVKQKCYFPGRIAVISATIKDLKDAVVVIHVSPFNAPVWQTVPDMVSLLEQLTYLLIYNV